MYMMIGKATFWYCYTLPHICCLFPAWLVNKMGAVNLSRQNPSVASTDTACNILFGGDFRKSASTLFLYTYSWTGERGGGEQIYLRPPNPLPLPCHHQTLLPLQAWEFGTMGSVGCFSSSNAGCQLNGQVRWLKELFYVLPVSVTARPKHAQISKFKHLPFDYILLICSVQLFLCIFWN